MIESETGKLLQVIAAVDYRDVNPLTVKAWHEAIGQLPYDLALAAVNRARRDTNIGFLTTRDVLTHAKIELRERERMSARRLERPERKPAPKPENFDAMTAAYGSGNQGWIDAELAAYNEQLRRVGYFDN